MHEKSADRHHNPARLTTASNHLRGSLRLWRDFTMIGVCSFYPFGVVIWQDVSNKSLQSRTCLLCVAKIYKNLNYRNFQLQIDVFLDKICLNYARNDEFRLFSQLKCVSL